MREEDTAISLVLRAARERVATLEQLMSEVYAVYADLGTGVYALEAQLRGRTEALDPAALHAELVELGQIMTQAHDSGLKERISAYYQGGTSAEPLPYQQVRVGLAMLEMVHRAMREQIARWPTDARAAMAEAADQMWREVLAAHEAALEQVYDFPTSWLSRPFDIGGELPVSALPSDCLYLTSWR